MSEAQRFWSHEASNIRCVREADFDRVTAERDAALVDRNYCKRVAEHNKEIGEQLQQRLTAADERADQLTQQLAIESAIKEPAGEDVLWQVLDAAVGVLTRRAAPHAWESEAHQAGLKIILARRAGLAATALKPAEGVGDDTTLEEDREDFKKVFVRINTKQGQSISLADMIARYEKKP